VDVNWRASLAGAAIYLFLMVVIGDLLINSVGEYVGPVTDMVITGLVSLIIVYVAARRSGEGQARFWGGVLTGGLCLAAQMILATFTIGMDVVALVIYFILFGGIALLGGFVAQRL